METFIDTHRGQYPVTFYQYPDGEWAVEIDNYDEIGNEVMVYHRLYPQPEQQLVKLAILMNKLGFLREVSVFAPYLPYSRQDKNGGSEMVCKLISNMGVRTLYTLDCHFMKNADYARMYGLSIRNIFARGFLVSKLPETCTFIAPDKGSAHLADGNHFDKTRVDGRIVDMRSNSSYGLSECVALIDDMISSGDTMIKAAQLIFNHPLDIRVYFVATHIFEHAKIKELEKWGVGILTTDSIYHPYTVVAEVKDIYNKEVRTRWLEDTRD